MAARASTATCTAPRSRVSARTSCARCRCPTSCATPAETGPERFVSFNVSRVPECVARARRAARRSTRTATRPARSSTPRSPRPSSTRFSRTTSRKTRSPLYLNANFKADKWFANLGVRWISTDTTAKTAVDAILFVDDPTPEIPTSSPDVTYSPAEPLTQKGSYDKLLPSLNFGYWLREDLIAAGGDCTHDDATLAQSARADAHGQHARSHVRRVLRRQCRSPAGRGGPGRSFGGMVLRGQVRAQWCGVLEGHQRLHHDRARRRTSTSASSAASAVRLPRRSSTT